MKKRCVLFNLLLALTLIIGQTMPAAGQSQSILRVSPASVALDPGQTATIEIVVDLADADLLAAFSVEIHFDPAYLSADNLQQGDFLDIWITEPGSDIDNDQGIIKFGGTQGSGVEPVSGSGTLFSFDIQAKNVPGLTALDVSRAELVGDDYLLIDAALQNGAVLINGDLNLMMSISPEGAGTTTPAVGTHVYDAGTVVEITATAADGYRFVDWSGDLEGVSDPYADTTAITMIGDTSITANFVRQYTLTLAVSPEAGGTINPAVGSYVFDAGTVVDITAIAADGYRFVDWSGNLEGVSDPNAASTTITMNGDTSITANFVRQYTLTTAVSPEGAGTTTPAIGSHVFDAGAVVDIYAIAADGYVFKNWTGDIGTIADPDLATTTITMDGDTSITANFVRQYTLTIAVSPEGAGTTTPAIGTHVVDAGAVVAITATAADGYRFINWTGDIEAIADPDLATTTITMDGDTSITANFVRQHTLTMAVSPDGAGTITPAVGSHVFDAGSVIDIAAVPGIGYRFTNWSGDLETVADLDLANTTITMDNDYSITANFAQNGTPAILIYLPLVLH